MSLTVETNTQLPLAHDIAAKMIQLGGHVIFFPRGQKAIKQSGWQNLATRDITVADQMIGDTPYCNVGVVGKSDGLWLFDDDKHILEEYEFQFGRINTYRTRSVSGGTHLYFKQNDRSREMGNINGTASDGSETWSARVLNRYVVAPGSSAHPDNDPNQPETFYTALDNIPTIEAPAEFIEFLKSKAVNKPKMPIGQAPVPGQPKIAHGGLHNWRLSQAGRLRNAGMNAEEIEPVLIRLAHEYCEEPVNEEACRRMAVSICNFPAGSPTATLEVSSVAPEPEELPVFEDTAYPVFPHWVMEGTSLYTQFVKPVCDINSRIDYFMWLPAMIVLLNFIGPKIKIVNNGLGSRPFRGSIYAILIGRKGKTNKSSSVDDAMTYFNYCGMLQHSNRDLKQAEGKTLTWTAGSMEGVGIDMQKSNCKNVLLVYDELSQLVNKAGIESSSLTSNLLTMYESKKFQNSVKSKHETFAVDPDTYCTSLIACTTDQKFAELWSKLAGSDTGLDDRFFFILQPETLPEPSIQTAVNTLLGSIETKKLVDKAVLQGTFAFEDTTLLKELVEIENRYATRAEKWALALAVDLGLNEIDNDCVERAVAIVKYEIAVKRYLKSYEATTREGQIQQEIRRTIELNKGTMSRRELMRKVHADRYGTSLWAQAYTGLLRAGIIREEGKMIQLLQKRDEEE
jgi:hypothetical protein